MGCSLCLGRIALTLTLHRSLCPRTITLVRSLPTGVPMKLADRLKDAGLPHAQGYVNGRWVDAYDGGCFDVTDPADGSVSSHRLPTWDGQKPCRQPLRRRRRPGLIGVP